jgi:hypothetical protein
MQELKATLGRFGAFDVVCTEDPYKGLLLAWPAGGVLVRVEKDAADLKLKTLAGRLRAHDKQKLVQWLKDTPSLPWGGEE